MMGCAHCDSLELCAADCSLAPWNQDRPLPPRGVCMLGYLLRQRRWIGEHVNDYARWIFWVDQINCNAWGSWPHYAGRQR